mgnify:CR=1 FL=1
MRRRGDRQQVLPVAVGNVLVPAFVKRHFPGREAGVMSAYAAALGAGAIPNPHAQASVQPEA